VRCAYRAGRLGLHPPGGCLAKACDNVVQHYDLDIVNCQLDGNVTQPAIH
jgi:hypothetical protein